MKRTFMGFGIQNTLNRVFTSAIYTYSIFFKSVGCMVLALLLFSCSSTHLIQRETLMDRSTLPPRYSIIFVIHGDSDYLYHDSRGNAHRADEEALIGATLVAERNPQAEVFIFHQRPRNHVLLFFPHPDGQMYYYRNGQLLAKKSYWRDQGQARFYPEAELYHRYHADEHPQLARLFFYFGHEIPGFDGVGYDASYGHWTFTVNDLAAGLKRITRESSRFDLIVLSTCFGGVPNTIAALAPYAKTIVASPDNLHLSYFSLHPFERLDVGLRDGDVATFAKKIARQSFDRLTEDVQTAVSVAVYDVNRVQAYLDSIDFVYDRTLTTLKGLNPESVKHCDCADDSAYVLPGMEDGVDVLYRPPRFGRLKHKQYHSGWECWMLVQ
ncbi:hypothetical protein JW960_16870 [candidate division KSB1 bacterium]|nr:hypothetical protein [candidate division KSB1 bacterium]